VSALGVGIAVAATIVGAVLIATASGHSSGKRASSRPPAAQAQAAPRTTVPATTTPPTTAATLVGQLVTLPTGDASVSVRGPFTLALQATGRCWVQVTGANGQTLFEGTLQQGEVQTVSGAAPLTVRIGNTRSIALRVDGSNLDLAGVANTANVNFQTG
jgi:cytoskeleton protein RodZ